MTHEKTLFNIEQKFMSSRRKFIRQTTTTLGGISLMNVLPMQAIASLQLSPDEKIKFISKFENEHHPELAYWFISPDLLPNQKYLSYLNNIADKCLYTMLFLTARAGADFYEINLMHPVFEKIVALAHKRNLKIGLQLWGNNENVSLENADCMIVDHEVALDENGNAGYTAKVKFIRFPKRLIKCDVLKVFAFKKSSEGFYEPHTVKDITDQCKIILPDKSAVQIKINGGKSLAGFTAYIMVQQYCSQSSNFGEDEINRFAHAMKAYSDIPFDGFALDEYGNKFVSRAGELKERGDGPFRGRWYSLAFEKKYLQSTGQSLIHTLFDARYAPADQPEVRTKAINHYMDFMRTGALRVEDAVYKKSKELWGKTIFNGIHDTYHNSLINDEIWANGIGWWKLPREYGQTDEKTSTPIQMGIAMAHPMNAMYNQYYNKIISEVISKALNDLRYGIRTHYHALNDKRPNRSDLMAPEAIEGINKVENCARLLNKLNPHLPEIKLLIVFGIEALCNWYPEAASRGLYDINDTLQVEEKAKEIWNAGYLNAVVPSGLIANGTLSLDADGHAVMHHHQFDTILYLYPQYAKESELEFLENFISHGGKLMIEGKATHDFNANNISERFQSIYSKATVRGYSIENLPKLGLKKNLVPDGCKTEDGVYVFTDINSLNTPASANFVIEIDDNKYSGEYKGLAAISFDEKNNVKKLAAAGLTLLKKNDETVLSSAQPCDIFFERASAEIIIAGDKKNNQPLVNKLI